MSEIHQHFIAFCSLSPTQLLDSFGPSGSRPRRASCPQQQPERETRVQHGHQRGHPALIPCQPLLLHSLTQLQLLWGSRCIYAGPVWKRTICATKFRHLQSATVLYECLMFVRWQLMSSVTFSSSCHKLCKNSVLIFVRALFKWAVRDMLVMKWSELTEGMSVSFIRAKEPALVRMNPVHLAIQVWAQKYVFVTESYRTLVVWFEVSLLEKLWHWSSGFNPLPLLFLRISGDHILNFPGYTFSVYHHSHKLKRNLQHYMTQIKIYALNSQSLIFAAEE